MIASAITSAREHATATQQTGGHRWTALVAAVCVAALGCSDSGTGPGPAVPLSISTTLSQETAPVSIGAADAPRLSRSGVRRTVTAVDGAGDTLRLDLAVIVIEDVQLHRQGAGDCGSGDACVATERSRMLLHLPMDTTQEVRSVGLVGQLDADVYDDIRFELGRVQASDTTAVDSFPNLQEGTSILIEGSYDGQPFTVTSDLVTSVEVTLSPALDVSDSPTATNVTLSAPVSRWFLGSDNTFLDPEASGAAAEIAESAAQSLSGFPDRDADGRPDRSGPVSGPS